MVLSPWQQQDQASNTAAFQCHRDTAALGLPHGGSRGSAGAAHIARGTGSPALPPAPPHVSLDKHELCSNSWTAVPEMSSARETPSTQAPERQRPQGSAVPSTRQRAAAARAPE